MNWYRRWRRRRAIKRIRQNVAFFGHNLSNLTDEEIEEGLVKVGKIFSTIGISAAEAAINLGNAMRRVNENSPV